MLHEGITVTGTIPSGTYSDENIKSYGHGMFQSVYDYPYLSSSANAIFDISCGYSNNSTLSSSVNNQHTKKLSIYNTFAQTLMGHDTTGSILEFDEDGDIASGGTKMREVLFLSFARLLNKDEIKKGTFTMSVISGTFVAAEAIQGATGTLYVTTLGDYGAATSYKINSPAGEYGILYTGTIAPLRPYGLIFYQAGIAVISGSFYDNMLISGSSAINNTATASFYFESATAKGFENVLTSSTIDTMADAFRYRLGNINFNNTTELHSTIYFCRANHNEFNYSSNPTYLTGSRIRVKDVSTDAPISYITSVGMYGADNELLAVAKLSEPLKKSVDNEITLRVRTDF